MTAWQLRVCIEGHTELLDAENEQLLAMAWHGANFSRASKLPKLSEILSRLKQPMEKLADGDIIGQMKLQMQRRGR